VAEMAHLTDWEGLLVPMRDHFEETGAIFGTQEHKENGCDWTTWVLRVLRPKGTIKAN
jgi:hypothetical protein